MLGNQKEQNDDDGDERRKRIFPLRQAIAPVKKPSDDLYAPGNSVEVGVGASQLQLGASHVAEAVDHVGIEGRRAMGQPLSDEVTCPLVNLDKVHHRRELLGQEKDLKGGI